MTTSSSEAQIRTIIAEHAGLNVPIESVDDSTDLFHCGMTSFTSVNVMLALEQAFDLEFPDAMLTRAVFGSIESISQAIDAMRAASR